MFNRSIEEFNCVGLQRFMLENNRRARKENTNHKTTIRLKSVFADCDRRAAASTDVQDSAANQKLPTAIS